MQATRPDVQRTQRTQRPVSGPRRGGGRACGFTLVECLVVAAVIAVLAAVLLPVFAHARETARKVVCASNLRQIGMAFRMYLSDWDGCFPNDNDPYLWMGRRWRWPLTPYLGQVIRRDPYAPQDPMRSRGAPGILICPSDPVAPEKWDGTSYGYSAAFYHTPRQINAMRTEDLTTLNRFAPVTQFENEVTYPGKKILAAEWLTNHDSVRVGWWDWQGGRNYLFVDGHARYLQASRLHAAVNGFPDINLTKNGIQGKDVD